MSAALNPKPPRPAFSSAPCRNGKSVPVEHLRGRHELEGKRQRHRPCVVTLCGVVVELAQLVDQAVGRLLFGVLPVDPVPLEAGHEERRDAPAVGKDPADVRILRAPPWNIRLTIVRVVSTGPSIALMEI